MRQPYDGVLLVGPPASGKRTVAFALQSLRATYAPFPALTVAHQPLVHGQRTTQAHLDELRSWAQMFHEFTIDGDSYAYDGERLGALRERGHVPVACVDDIAGLEAFEREAGDWLAILLWCPREAAERRLASDRSVWADREAYVRRLVRWWDRSTRVLLRDVSRFTVVLRSDHVNAVQIAQIVHLAAQAGVPGTDSEPASDVESGDGNGGSFTAASPGAV